MKTWKIKQKLKAEQSNLTNSTFITCLFNLRRKEKGNYTHKTSVNLKPQREIHHHNIEPHGSQRVLQTLVYSFAKIAEMKCTLKRQEIPSILPLKITEEIHDIDKTNSFPCL